MIYGKSLETIVMILGIIFIWIGTILYIFPFMLWIIPSLILGFSFILTGCLLVAYKTILITIKSKTSKYMLVAGIAAAVFIILWGILYIIAIFIP